MPLSEHEQRLLEQMERALYAEDPKLASTLRGADLRAHHRRRVALGRRLPRRARPPDGRCQPSVAVVGVVGFLLMLASAWWVTTGWRARRVPPPSPGRRLPAPPAPRPRPRLVRRASMDRLEDRWRRRREGENPN